MGGEEKAVHLSSNLPFLSVEIAANVYQYKYLNVDTPLFARKRVFKQSLSLAY